MRLSLTIKVHECILGARISRHFRLPIFSFANAEHFCQTSKLFGLESAFEVDVHTCMLLRQAAMTVTVTFVSTRVTTIMT